MQRNIWFLLLPVVVVAGLTAPGLETAGATVTVVVENSFQVPESVTPPTSTGDYVVGKDETENVLLTGVQRPGMPEEPGLLAQQAHVYLSMFGVSDNPDVADDPIDKLIDELQSEHDWVHVVLGNSDAVAGTQPPTALIGTCTAAHGCTCNVPKMLPQGQIDPGPDATHPSVWTRAAARLWCLATDNGTNTTTNNSPFHVCTGSCITPGSDHINHNKFMVIDPVGGGPGIVVQESANWTVDQFENRYQTVTVVKNDDNPAAPPDYLVQSYMGEWRAEYNETASFYGHPYFQDPNLDLYAEFFPRASDDDLRLTALGKAHCGGTIASGNTKIWVTTNILSDTTYASKLDDMRTAGCDVEAIVKDSSATTTVPVVHAALHSKDLVIDGTYQSDGSRDRVVFTGSRPVGLGVETSDNAMLRLQGATIVGDFERQFCNVWTENSASPPPPTC